MIEALTLRGLEDPDMIKPDDGKSENQRQKRNLSKDHDRGFDSERT